MTNVGGITVFGATYPARIWRTFMQNATAPLPALDFAQPNNTLFEHSRFISELGRRVSFLPQYSPPPLSVPDQNAPSTSVPTATTEAPKQSPKTTVAPPPTTPPPPPPSTVGPPVTHKKRHRP